MMYRSQSISDEIHWDVLCAYLCAMWWMKSTNIYKQFPNFHHKWFVYSVNPPKKNQKDGKGMGFAADTRKKIRWDNRIKSMNEDIRSCGSVKQEDKPSIWEW